MRVRVKNLKGKYTGRIGFAEHTACEENAMVYPIGENPYRVCIPWRDLEVVDNEV